MKLRLKVDGHGPDALGFQLADQSAAEILHQGLPFTPGDDPVPAGSQGFLFLAGLGFGRLGKGDGNYPKPGWFRKVGITVLQAEDFSGAPVEGADVLLQKSEILVVSGSNAKDGRIPEGFFRVAQTCEIIGFQPLIGDLEKLLEFLIVHSGSFLSTDSLFVQRISPWFLKELWDFMVPQSFR